VSEILRPFDWESRVAIRVVRAQSRGFLDTMVKEGSVARSYGREGEAYKIDVGKLMSFGPLYRRKYYLVLPLELFDMADRLVYVKASESWLCDYFASKGYAVGYQLRDGGFGLSQLLFRDSLLGDNLGGI